ncbi:MAG: 3'(2'),5'-bisphosphate nucleotidase CysQ [Polyangiales bacterium]
MFEAELEAASTLARAAGRAVLEVYGSELHVELKGGADPVTEADRNANTLLVQGLRAHFADDGIVAEEGSDQADGASRPRCWFVDPLDGTKEFIARNGEFSVMLGLAIEGRAVLGVVYQPVGDTLYRGVIGQGAQLEQRGALRPLTVSELAEPARLKLVVSRSHRSSKTDAVVQRLGITAERPSGSVGLKVGCIVKREADLYVHISDRSSKWDACGPEAILRAAGGRFTDLLGRPIDYRENDLRNASGLLACNAAAFDAVLPVVSAVAREAGFS